MNHPDLFETYAARPSRNFRRTDPITSRDAGRQARRFEHSDQAEILRALRETGVPMAGEQLSDHLGWNNSVRVMRRIASMISAGLIERTTERHTNRNGRQAFKHRLVPA